MAIGDDFSVATNGNIRHTSGTTTYTVLELHRWLQDLADDASSSGDDNVDITTGVPSERAYDALITLNDPGAGVTYNIDDTAAEYLYGGTIIQNGGDVVYSGLRVVGATETGTQLQIVQNGSILTSYWGTGLNNSGSTLLQILVKSRTGGADIDGKRIRVFAREQGDTYDEFEVTLSDGGVETAAITTVPDLNYQTAGGVISGWPIANDNEGYIGLDVDNNTTNEFYFANWDLNGQAQNDLYEFGKYLCRRGTVSTLYGLNGALYRGITHEIDVDTPTGTFNAFEAVSWTGGTGQMLAINSTTAATKMWIQLLTGVVPSDNDVITGGTSAATCQMNVTVTARPLSKQILGTATGSAILGAYGVGIDPADIGASDQVTDLTNTVVTPPNNVQFNVAGCVIGEDYVLVSPSSGGARNPSQLSLGTALTGATETSVVVTTTIPTDTPATGTIRVTTNGGREVRCVYTSFTGSTFTITSTDFSSDNASATNDVCISYIDKLATATTESFTVVYSADRELNVRRRDGGAASPTKPFETTATLGSSGGSVTVQRTAD